MFASLLKHEQAGAKSRIEKLEEETENVKKVEAQLQKKYSQAFAETKRE